MNSKVESFDYLEPGSAEELRLHAEAAAREGYDRVIAAGGDGTVNALMNGLLGSDTALGILPLGHGNDFARSLGIPLDPRAAVDFLLHASVESMDVVRIGDRAYAGIAGMGLDAETNRRANAWGSWPTGHLRYFLAGLRTLLGFRPLRVELVTDSEEFSGEVMWIAVANSAFYGGGLRIAPEAAVDDGVLDVCVIEKMSPLRLLALYPSLMRGTHVRSRGVRYFRSTWVRLRSPVGTAVFGDGELLGEVPLEARIDPGALRVLRRPD